MAENSGVSSAKKFAEKVFGAEENSAAKLGEKKLSKFNNIATRMFHTRVLGPKELIFPAVGAFATQMMAGLEQYRMLYYVNVLKIDMVYIAFIGLLIGIYDVLNNPLMGAIYDRTRTRWGKSRPYIIFTAVPYFLSTVAIYSGGLFFGDKPGNDRSKILFVFIACFIQETFSTMYTIPRGGLQNLQTPNPKDRITVGLWVQYVGNLGAQVIFISFLPLMELSNKGYISADLTVVFAAMAAAAGIVGCIGNISMALYCKERVILQPQPASVTKTLFYIFKNKYALRNYVVQFLFSWESNGGYKWDVVTQQEIFGGSIPTLIAYAPYTILDVVSVAFVPWFQRTFKNNRNCVLVIRIWDILARVALTILGCMFIDKKWVMVGIFAFFWGLTGANNGPATVFEQEVGREIFDYTEYLTGERPDGTINILTSLALKVTAPLQTALTIFLFKWSGYDTTQPMLPWQQGSKKVYQRVFFLWQGLELITKSCYLIPMFMYDLVGEKRERMYVELNARRALVANGPSMEEQFIEDLASQIENVE